MLHHLHRFASPANVAATLALVIALSGTSYAAVQITGAQVKDNSLEGRHFKNATINAGKIDAKTRASFIGATGTPGTTGPKGQRGVKGPDGEQGDPGKPAQVFSSFASWDSGYVSTSDSNALRSDPGTEDWFAYGTGCSAPNCHLVPANAGGALPIAAGNVVMSLDASSPTGGNRQTNGFVQAGWAQTTMRAWGTVTLLYRADSEDGAAARHTRVACTMLVDNVPAGPTVFASAGTQREIKQVSLVGNLERGPGVYNAQISCRDADPTPGRTRWTAVRGNLVLSASEKVGL